MDELSFFILLAVVSYLFIVCIIQSLPTSMEELP
jgi:hypothetical protein